MMKEYPEGFWDTHDTYFLYVKKEVLLELGVPEDEIYPVEMVYWMSKHGQAKADGMLMAVLTKEQAVAMIPKGVYCYTPVRPPCQENGMRYEIKPCPFLDMFPQLPHQSNGFCHFLKIGDFTKPGTELLWDQCKECGEKSEEPETLETETEPTSEKLEGKGE